MSAHNQSKDSKGLPKDLYSATVIATNTTTVSDAIQLPVHANQIIALSIVSARTDGTFTTTIQHSPDGTNWYDWVSGSAQLANGTAQIYSTDNKPIMTYVRASIVSTLTTIGATVAVELYFGNQR